jgi:hypothetical protein
MPVKGFSQSVSQAEIKQAEIKIRDFHSKANSKAVLALKLSWLLSDWLLITELEAAGCFVESR